MLGTTKKLVLMGALAMGGGATLLLGGCASNGQPFGLTGEVDRKEMVERARWTDDKGHYRPEWRDSSWAPAGYPKGKPPKFD